MKVFKSVCIVVVRLSLFFIIKMKVFDVIVFCFDFRSSLIFKNYLDKFVFSFIIGIWIIIYLSLIIFEIGLVIGLLLKIV